MGSEAGRDTSDHTSTNCGRLRLRILDLWRTSSVGLVGTGRGTILACILLPARTEVSDEDRESKAFVMIHLIPGASKDDTLTAHANVATTGPKAHPGTSRSLDDFGIAGSIGVSG